MIQRVINNLRLKTDSFPEPTQSYKINKKGKFVWLQKLCYKILSNYGKEYIDSKSYIKVEVIDTSDIIDLIFETIKNMELYGARCKYILVGDEQMKKLWKVETGFYKAAVNIKFGRHWQTYVFGCEVILYPWIDGIICLPDIIVKHQQGANDG